LDYKKFSIIIPAYNCAEQLKNLLAQIEEFDYPQEHYEVVVVNDGSSDHTADVARGSNVRRIDHPENLGRVSARESGAKAAKYESLVFIDARLSIQKDLLKKAHELNYLPLMGVGTSDKTLSSIDRVFYCIRRKTYHPYEPQHKYNKELWLKPGGFDGRPKGTGLLIIDRSMFLNCALEDKGQDVNDDTRLLHQIVHEGAPILRHTDLSFFYHHRQSWPELLKHTYFRGPKFLDYYLTPGGPLFKTYLFGWLVLAFFLFSALSYPILWTILFIGIVLIHLGVCTWLSEELRDFSTCFIFFPPIALAFGFGILSAQIARWLSIRQLIKH
jgi:glycosyltransferase involved in cell wall biosynthesis